jgi:hypothetical protein
MTGSPARRRQHSMTVLVPGPLMQIVVVVEKAGLPSS